MEPKSLVERGCKSGGGVCCCPHTFPHTNHCRGSGGGGVVLGGQTERRGGVPREMGEVEKDLTPPGMLLENARAPKEGFPPVNLGVDVCAGIDEVEDFGVG